ncbi:hypothetical protein KC669_05000 [Candidatus Dojkabacteria bacterium]|uniref:Uncharacterized protein n=1 Tax=Candidatus Dojkabacteria bacterium TaxID=2099670 RepID=A0A955LAX3_9BACT|nr:hypothetical protein [Candidatus Dojkabacteria bacterium]
MNNVLVTEEEFIEYKEGVGGLKIKEYLEHILNLIRREYICSESEIEFYFEKDQNIDEFSASQRYYIKCSCPKHDIVEYFEKNGPYTMYVRM